MSATSTPRVILTDAPPGRVALTFRVKGMISAVSPALVPELMTLTLAFGLPLASGVQVTLSSNVSQLDHCFTRAGTYDNMDVTTIDTSGTVFATSRCQSSATPAKYGSLHTS